MFGPTCRNRSVFFPIALDLFCRKGVYHLKNKVSGREDALGFGLQTVRCGGEAWGKALPRMWNIKTGFGAAGIHYLADCFRALLARLVDCRLSSVVRVKLSVGADKQLSRTDY
jgi:hypothetical protein